MLVLGSTIFAFKVFALGLPLVPAPPAGLWRVDLEVMVRGGERGTVRAALPTTRNGQVVFDEASASDRLNLTIKTEDGQRTGTFSGPLRGLHRLSYSFHAQLGGERFELPAAPELTAPEPKHLKLLAPEPTLPTESPEIAALLEELGLPAEDDPSGRLRTIFAFVNREVSTAPSASDDGLIALHEREGSALGKSRLLVTLLRAAKIPARPAVGLRLRPEHPPLEESFVEARLGGKWVPFSPSAPFFAERPADLLHLGSGDQLVGSTGTEAIEHRFHALRESLSRKQLAEMMVPDNPVFAAVSLYRLPGTTQETLRMILRLPVGALILSIFRNVVGVPTYGTFLPVLIAMALGHTGLAFGLALLVTVLALGIATRQFLDRLHLLVVPRLSIILSVVVLSMTSAALIAERLEIRDLFGSVLFPLVIISTLIERVTLTIEEEGYRNALTQALWTSLTALAIYPVFRSDVCAHLMFGFPELVLVVIGSLIFVGGYTGYRFLEVLRFGSLAREILMRKGGSS